MKDHLYQAILNANSSEVRIALDNGAPCSYINEAGESYLHILSKHSKKDETEKAENGRREIVYMLCDDGLDPNLQDSENKTALDYSMKSGDCVVTSALLQCGAHIPVIYNERQYSPDVMKIIKQFKPGLVTAVQNSSITDARRLINMWCRTDLVKDGKTLKEMALDTGHEEIIGLILGVQPSMLLVHHMLSRNAKKVRAILETQRHNIQLDLRNMSDHGAPILYYAIKNCDVEIAELLIQNGCHIFTLMRDQEGCEMPVIFSALHPEIPLSLMEVLLPEQKPDQENLLRRLLYKGETFLEVALHRGVTLEILTLLIKRAGPLALTSRNQREETIRDVAERLQLFHYVSAIDKVVMDWILNSEKYPGLCKLLALHGYDHIQDIFDMTLKDSYPEDSLLYLENIDDYQNHISLLSKAAQEGDLESFCSLSTYTKEKVCDVFETNLSWNTRPKGEGLPLLHRAVLYNHPTIVSNILQKIPPSESIDTLLDHHHRTALHYAYGMVNGKEIQKLLQGSGCSEHTLDRNGKEALDFKDKAGSSEMEALLDSVKNRIHRSNSALWNAPKKTALNSKPSHNKHGSKVMGRTSPTMCSHHFHHNCTVPSTMYPFHEKPVSEEDNGNKTWCHII